MLEYFCIFLQSGFILWKYETAALRGSPINEMIKSVILEERSGLDSFSYEGKYTLKWTQANDIDLIFVAVYQSFPRLPSSYIDSLLEKVKKSFLEMYGTNIRIGKNYSFEKEYENILREIQTLSTQTKNQKTPAPFDESKKKKKLQQNGITPVIRGKETETKETDKKPKTESATSEGPGNEGNGETAAEEPPKPASLFPNPFLKIQPRPKIPGTYKSSKSKKTKPNQTPEPAPGTKPKKAPTTWDKEDTKILDFSDKTEKNMEEITEKEEIFIDKFSDSESSSSSEEEESASKPAKPSGLMSFFSNMVNKELTAADLEPVLKQFADHLISKNVAAEIAEKLCESVSQSLIGKKMSTFSRISTTVKEAMESALTRILTPKRTIDVLRDARAAKARNVPYAITFVGVNGVGKSTSLSKVCSWLLQNDLKVMIAACDTFRAGAVEQLQVHGKNLGVDVFHRGYGKDPSGVAGEALNFAKKNHIDVVLIDTAGRMQDNHLLMSALAKLVGVNKPDLVLFVGEALVGNEAVDQLTKFNRALEEFAIDRNARGIDGIFLTKFDTVDEKVGAAISMVYTTGQPIVFVGIGQKYSDLKVLNVPRIVSILLKGK